MGNGHSTPLAENMGDDDDDEDEVLIIVNSCWIGEIIVVGVVVSVIDWS